LKSVALSYEIRINDVPLDGGSGSVDTELPLNQWIWSGENELTIHFKSGLSENSRMEAEVQAREIDAGFDQSVTFSRILIQPVNGLPSIEESGDYVGSREPLLIEDLSGNYVASRRFLFSAPFRPWAWTRGDQIAEDQNTFGTLLNQYRQFHALIRSGNVAGVEAAMMRAVEEYMEAYYISDVRQALDDFEVSGLMTDPNVRLADFVPASTRLQIFGNGRLARLVDPEGESPIMFDESGLDVHVDFMYCRSANQWIQIR